MSHCEQKFTGYAQHTCYDRAVFLVKIPHHDATAACAQHLAKAVRAYATQHSKDAVAVILVDRKENTAA